MTQIEITEQVNIVQQMETVKLGSVSFFGYEMDVKCVIKSSREWKNSFLNRWQGHLSFHRLHC